MTRARRTPDDDVMYATLLAELGSLTPGEPIPSVRSLMARFGVSQLIVDRVMARLRERLPIVSQVGRGSFMGGEGLAVAARRELRVLTPRGESVMMRTLEAALSRTFAGAGYRVVLRHYAWDRFPSRIEVTGQVAALLVVPPSFLNGAQLATLERVPVPVVLLDLVPQGLRLHGVASDNEYGGAMAAERLLALGASRLLAVSAEPSVSRNVQDRLRGFERQCRLRGVAAPLVLDCGAGPGTDVARLARLRMAALLAARAGAGERGAGAERGLADAGGVGAGAAGERAAEAGDFGAAGEPGAVSSVSAADFDGVFTVSDGTALGVCLACADAGIRVPEELRLVSFDGIPAAAGLSAPCPVIEQDLARWATTALEIVESSGDGDGDGEAGPRGVYVEPLLRMSGSDGGGAGATGAAGAATTATAPGAGATPGSKAAPVRGEATFLS